MQFPIIVAKVLANESFTPTVYFGVGTGTTAETRSDTALGTELFRKAATVSHTNGVICGELLLYTTDTSANGNLREVGWFDAASNGNMIARGTFGSAVVHDSDSWTKIVMFADFDTDNDSDTIINASFIDNILSGLEDGTFTSGTHIAIGTKDTFDKCDATTGWTESADATAPTTNTTDYKDATASLKFGKDGTSSTAFYYEKTLGAPVNFSANTNLTFFVDFIDVADYSKLSATNPMTIWIGNDSSNYKKYEFGPTEISLGWKFYDVLISSMTNVGSPDLATCDYIRITFNTTNATDTITHGNILFDFVSFYRQFDYNDTTMIEEQYRSAMISGYPTRFDTNVVWKSEVLSNQGNTFLYNYLAMYDAASSGNQLFQIYFYDLQKDSNTSVTEEININTKISDD